MVLNQGAPFLSTEASDVGLSTSQLREAVRVGAVRRVFRGVLIDGTVPDSRDLRLDALSLIVPTEATVGDHTAAELLGAQTRPPHLQRELRPMLVVRHGSTRSEQKRAIVRQSTVPDHEAVVLRGVRVTSPLRTTIDLLRLSWRPYALAAADALVRADAVALDAVLEEVARLRKLPGTRQAQELAPWIDRDAASHGESWMRCRIRDAGLPRPVLAYRVELRDGRERWLDSAWKESLTAAEYDGRTHHSSLEDVQHDTARREEISHQLYWRFVVATRERIFGTDDSFEREAGELLCVSVRPRTW